MGWTHPAQGLARWLDEGGDDVCPALSLVRHVWLGHSVLLNYMAWRVQQTLIICLQRGWPRSAGMKITLRKKGCRSGPGDYISRSSGCT